VDPNTRFAIVCCGGIAAWFVTETNRAVCLEALQVANPQVEYSVKEVSVSDLEDNQGQDE